LISNFVFVVIVEQIALTDISQTNFLSTAAIIATSIVVPLFFLICCCVIAFRQRKTGGFMAKCCRYSDLDSQSHEKYPQELSVSSIFPDGDESFIDWIELDGEPVVQRK
jgi:hypothetical protein